ncbi:MAG: PqqD family protein [Acidobacteria bacterium]|nr:PqqD family protein [Acidobacteriota bacterium]
MELQDSAPVYGKAMPRSRDEDIVVQEVGDEILVYDLKTNRAHHLNQTISIVWKQSDGNTPLAEIARILSGKLNTRIEEDFVLMALAELKKIDLLDESAAETGIAGISRREIFFKYALPAIAFPVVVSLVTPASAQVQGSCLGVGQINCFNQNTPCCPGLTCIPQQQGGVVGPGVCTQIIN